VDNLGLSKKGSHSIQLGLVSSHVTNQAPPSSYEDDSRADDLDEDKANQHIMSKEDAKTVMKTKEFDIFINKTSKIVERALTGSVDVLGAGFFFEDGQNSLEVEEASRAAE